MTQAQTDTIPEVEVDPKARRRQFSAKYKLDVLKRAAACVVPGQLGELLRSEGLYSSHPVTWRRQQPLDSFALFVAQVAGIALSFHAFAIARPGQTSTLQTRSERLAKEVIALKAYVNRATPDTREPDGAVLKA